MENIRDVVIGIDSSTTAIKAIGWTQDGSIAVIYFKGMDELQVFNSIGISLSLRTR